MEKCSNLGLKICQILPATQDTSLQGTLFSETVGMTVKVSADIL